MGLLAEARRQELSELGATLVEHADSRIASPGYLPCGLQHAVQHDLEVELGDKRAPHLQKAVKPEIISSWLHDPSLVSICATPLPARRNLQTICVERCRPQEQLAIGSQPRDSRGFTRVQCTLARPTLVGRMSEL